MSRASTLPVLLALTLTGCGSTTTVASGSETRAAEATAVGTTTTTPAQPKSLEAATAAVQEWADRRSSEDYAGVWQLFNEQVRHAISEADYVTLSETCTSPLTTFPETATGVRMETPDKAIVRLEALGFKIAADVLYEDGRWVLAPEPEFEADLGKPVQQIIAERKAEGGCEAA